MVLRKEDRAKARAATKRRQAEHDAAVWPKIRPWMEDGMSAAKVADTLNVIGVPSPRGGYGGGWTAAAVLRIRRRMQESLIKSR